MDYWPFMWNLGEEYGVFEIVRNGAVTFVVEWEGEDVIYHKGTLSFETAPVHVEVDWEVTA